jgi:hypothetical protein
MIVKLDDRIFKRMARAKRGAIFFARDFIAYHKPAAVRRALRRLTKAGKLSSMDGRIYFRPQMDPVIGPLMSIPAKLTP